MLSNSIGKPVNKGEFSDRDSLELQANITSWEGPWEELGLMGVLMLCIMARTLHMRPLQEELGL